MYLVVSPNQLSYFKPETTAQRLKNFLQKTQDEKRFLTYLYFIEICSKLFVKVAPLQPKLYQDEVITIFHKASWEPFLGEYLIFFRPFFKDELWVYMLRKLRHFQHLFLLMALKMSLVHNSKKLLSVNNSAVNRVLSLQLNSS